MDLVVTWSDGATYVSQLKCFTTSIISAALSPPLQWDSRPVSPKQWDGDKWTSALGRMIFFHGAKGEYGRVRVNVKVLRLMTPQFDIGFSHQSCNNNLTQANLRIILRRGPHPVCEISSIWPQGLLLPLQIYCFQKYEGGLVSSELVWVMNLARIVMDQTDLQVIILMMVFQTMATEP